MSGTASLDALSLFGTRRRLPMILQTEGAECGLACLAMIAARHGFDSDLATLRRRFSVSMKGATMADLVRVAGQLHLNPRAVRVEMEHLPQLELPCVLHWDLNHFVVLKEISGGRAVIHDPARGVRRLPMDEVSRHFTGIALELTPEADFRPGVEKQTVGLRQLLGRVSGLKRSLAQIFLLALALEAFVLLTPFYLQWVVDGVLVSNDKDLLVTLGIGFGLLVLIQVGAGAIRSWAVLHLSSTLNLQWLGNVFAHLMRLPVSWFDHRHTGDVMSRFGAVQRIQQTMTTSFVEAVLDGLLVVVTLAMMLVYSGTLAAIALASVVAYGLLAARLLPAAARGHRGGDRLRRQALDALSGVAARSSVDQALQPPGRPAGAVHESRRRRDERRHRHAQARPDVRRAAEAPVRRRAGSGHLGRRAAGARPSLLGRDAVRLPRLP